MSTFNLAEKLEERKAKAEALLKASAVSPNGIERCYYVQSQSGNGVYVVSLTDRTCTCEDAWGRQHLGLCKHLIAAFLLEHQTKAVALAAHHITGSIHFYVLPEGIDCEVTCTCGYVSPGFTQYSQAEAYAKALNHHQEHVRLVLEHFERCPSDFRPADFGEVTHERTV